MTLDQWLDETENFSTRRERLAGEVGTDPRVLAWLQAAWDMGAASEREACAAIAAAYGTTPGYPDGKTGAFRKHRHQIAYAIRIRKTTQ